MLFRSRVAIAAAEGPAGLTGGATCRGVTCWSFVSLEVIPAPRGNPEVLTACSTTAAPAEVERRTNRRNECGSPRLKGVHSGWAQLDDRMPLGKRVGGMDHRTATQ